MAALRIVGLTLALCSCQTLFAQQEKWTHYGVRPLAMGNAYVAVADDFNALFYNPAGLARQSEWRGELINPYLEISNSTTTFLNDARKLGDGSAGDTVAVLDLLESQTGNVQHLALGLTPHLIIGGFGIGIGFELSSTMIFHRYPTVDLDVGPSVIIPIQYAFSILENRLSIGFGVKARIDGGLDHEFSIQDLEAFTTSKETKEFEEGEEIDDELTLKDFVQGGRGFGADVGILFTPTKTMEPTLGVSITDLGGTVYEKFDVGSEAIGKPEMKLPSVNTGISFKPYQANSNHLLIAADAHSINQPFSFSKKLNFGAEWSLGDMFKLQCGLHQGYLAAGFQFDVRLLKVRFATYSEEMGATAGSIEDRRYALQLRLLI